MNRTGEFCTDSLPFACFLHATRRLRFLRCEPVDEGGRMEFIFADPMGRGEGIHLEFESGAVAPAAAFFDSIRHLRRVMDKSKEQENRVHGSVFSR